MRQFDGKNPGPRAIFNSEKINRALWNFYSPPGFGGPTDFYVSGFSLEANRNVLGYFVIHSFKEYYGND